MEFASRRTSLVAGLIAVLSAALLVSAGCRRRTAPGHGRPGAARPATATSSLQGRVVDTAGRAVPEARVLASALTDGGSGTPRETVSDREGRFRLDRVPAGRY